MLSYSYEQLYVSIEFRQVGIAANHLVLLPPNERGH